MYLVYPLIKTLFLYICILLLHLSLFFRGQFPVCCFIPVPVNVDNEERSYKFRQASDFWYLTGFEEPDSAVVLEKISSSRGYRMTLFSSGKDSARELWEGAKTSFQDAITYFKSDDAQPISQFPSILKSLASYHSNIYLDVPHTPINVKRSRLFQKSILKVCKHLPFQTAFADPSLVFSTSRQTDLTVRRTTKV